MGIASVVTISPRVPVAELERRARVRIERDGVAVFAAVTADSRQRAHLLRLRARLVADPAFKVIGGTGRPDGTTHLIVVTAGQQPPVGWFGGAKTDVVEDPDGDYWSALEPDPADLHLR
jgi:hypothetical protein